ncbi:MAG: hypothetical protein Q8M20_17875 [Rhodocyclaceae bacterium]|nr:hypothetical protein [Rhodocyclaceae bacterium]MDZ4213730.1 hypothetical protein [Rhodocyclaceae bacterium]
MNMAERVFEEVRALPEFELREVLDFVGYLKSRHGLPTVAASNDAVVDWDGLQVHARGLITEPVKSPDLALMDEVGRKVCQGVTWSRDELYDRGLR